jgi:ADP-L-glycero-D-manno-heptose 6-epimerase
MIVITGAAGFIGSNLIKKLNDEGFYDLVLVDDFTKTAKKNNYIQKQFSYTVERTGFTEWLTNNHKHIQFVFHIGARTDTAEFDKTVFDLLNLNYSKMVWQTCAAYGIPLIYASSAATYGLGEYGYIDNHDIIDKLIPLNPYGESKNEFDKWALKQKQQPYFWAGLKFFNVYGPNEYHKGRMASVIFHAHKQIKETGKMKLFRSHHHDYKDGQQMRDFVYVKDVVNVMYFLMNHRKYSGIYNLGSGKARTFLDLTNGTFRAMNIEPDITFIDTPADIRDKYQYFTEANMQKLHAIGYNKTFWSLEEGIKDYVQQFLANQQYH